MSISSILFLIGMLIKNHLMSNVFGSSDYRLRSEWS
jgi:hypothetical protein